MMSYVLDRPGFSVRVDGRFVDEGTWLNHAVVSYRPHASSDEPGGSAADGRRELILGIARHSRLARLLGARSVYVLVEGDGEVAGFFRVSESAPDTEIAGALRRQRMAISPPKRPIRERLTALMETFLPVA
jgi:hypothetical protein